MAERPGVRARLIAPELRDGATTAMRVGDDDPVGTRWWARLPGKGGRHPEMPCRHMLGAWRDARIEADSRASLWRGFADRAEQQRRTQLLTSTARLNDLTLI